VDSDGDVTATSYTADPTDAPGISLIDKGGDDNDVSAKIYHNLTTTTGAGEIGDMYFQAMGGAGTAGTLETFMHFDGSAEQLDITGDVSISGSRVLPITLSADDTVSGDIITVTFGESVVFGEVCYPDLTQNEWMKALGTNVAATHPGMGIALESKGNGESGKLLLRGTIRDDSAFAGVMGDIVYLSDGTAGDVLYAAPTTTGDIVQILGFVIADNYFYFNPDYTYVEVP